MRLRACSLLALAALAGPMMSQAQASSDQPAMPITCSTENPQLVAWVHAHAAEAMPRSAGYHEFILELKAALDARMLPTRAVVHLFGEESPVHPTCAGHWLVRAAAAELHLQPALQRMCCSQEFGVFTGGTINLAAGAKWARCGPFCPHMFGFDTFSGACLACLLPRHAWARSLMLPPLRRPARGVEEKGRGCAPDRLAGWHL